ncbi:MAG: TrkA family potassium uptake protein, partial [Prevotellaceae bacterium]|nr:TrkA family potassium uptake protein [Prevotellaceae bacterium]
MKYIVAGLGHFGASLAQKLTAQGHEVIGIDNRMHLVDLYKEKISHTICMDTTDELTVSGLPIEDTDIVIVSIGEEQGANVMTTAVFKNLQAKRLISRAINPLHEKVLQAIGVDEIVHPEEETAERWAKKLCLENILDSFELNDDYSVIKTTMPEEYIGKSIDEVKVYRRFNLLILSTIKKVEVKSFLGSKGTMSTIRKIATPDLVFEKSDILV